jgi:hypothetical protein
MQYLNLRPSQVILDPANPRLPDGTSSDREAINRLLDDGADALTALARDMAKTGQSNPAELPIAIKDGNKYLILEGNRRFAALKLLKDPALADNEEHQKFFRRAAALGTPPKTVFTVVVPNREAADRWIVFRHTGENNGVGVKRWSAGQTATHRRRANKAIDSGTLRSIIIADELEEAYAADEQIVELVRQVRRGKLTNIGRFFSPDVLSALHFTLNTEEASSLRPKALYVRHSADQLRGFFAWALAYILNHPVDAYKNAVIRQRALMSVMELLPNLADAATESFRLVDRTPTSVGNSRPADSSGTQPDDEADASSTDDEADAYSPSTGSSSGNGPTTNGANAAPSTSGQKERQKGGEARPERYLLQGLKLPNHPPRVQHLLRECRSLDLEAYPGIACVMMRVIVELSVSSQPALALSGSSESDPLRVKITDMLKYLDPNIENPRTRDDDLEQAYFEASQLGVQYLNGFLHNPAVYPDPHLARRFSSAFRPLLERVDEKL